MFQAVVDGVQAVIHLLQAVTVEVQAVETLVAMKNNALAKRYF